MSENLRLEVRRVIRAKRQSVFEAWTKPELMRQWFAPGAMTVTSAVADPKVGGSYRIEMSGDNGTGKCVNAAVTGTYKKIIPNELICFTWGWPGDPAPETLVTVEFKDAEGGTEVTLTHRGFASTEAFDKHQHGWLGCFENLSRFWVFLRVADTTTTEEEAPETDTQDDYVRRVPFRAPRERVFDAIATVDGVRGWWTTIVSGSGATGGDLHLEFVGLDEHIIMHVDHARVPSSIQWTCVVHTGLPEWAGTKMTFDLVELSPEACELNFRHVGLTPKLECYDHCEIGWNRFLASLMAYVETGEGAPFGVSRAHESTRTR